MLVITSALAGIPCGFVPPPPAPLPELPKTTGEPGVRDGFGVFETWETEHFAIKWGPALSPTPEHLALLEEDLERVWDGQIDALGWLPPAGAEAFKLNVYLASTGGGAPEIDFDGGYVWTDEEGFPYIALYPTCLEVYDDPFASFTNVELVAHEFNHTLQIRDSAFSFNRYGPYLWEATASWVVPETLGTAPSRGWGRFLLYPHVSLDMWALFGDDPSREGRQYDTALFLHYLTAQRGLGPDFLRDAWEQATPEDEPLHYLDRELDGGLRPVYLDFARQYALGDHDLGDLYLTGMDELTNWGGVPDDRITVSVPSAGAPWGRPPPSLRPQAWSWNHLTWRSPGTGSIVVSFEAEPEGTRGTASDLTGLVVHERDGRFTDASLGAPVEVLRDDVVHLLVVSTPLNPDIDERFGYTYGFAPDVEVEVAPLASETVREGCSCATQGPESLGALVLAVLFGVRRARRA
ncbi:MAG: DUF6055 domain-containing protein [Myxococcota bacterium]